MKFTPFLSLCICVIIGVLAFFFGYFRGYHDRSRILTGLYLSLHESQFDQLKQNKLDLLEINLKSSIRMGVESYKKLDSHSFRHFIDEFETSKAGDISKQIQKADLITSGMTFSDAPPIFGGISGDTK